MAGLLTAGLAAGPGAPPALAEQSASVIGRMRQDRQPHDNAPEDLPVQQRRQTYDKDVYGFGIGSFILTPHLTTGMSYDSNIYATPDGVVGDTILSAAPRLRLNSRWTRHEMELDAGLVRRQFIRMPDESTTDAALRLRGRLDIDARTSASLFGSVSRLHEARDMQETPGGLLRPQAYTALDGGAVLERRFNDIGVWLSGRSLRYTYADSELRNGERVSAASRDMTINEVGAGAAYMLSPSLALFGEIVGNRRDYRYTAIRNSHGYRALAGVDLDMDGFLKARLGAGYLRQRFTDVNVGEVGGITYTATIDWSPTRLWTLSIIGTRQISDSPSGVADGRIDTNIGATVYYELRRGLTLKAGTQYWRREYIGDSRRDNDTIFNVGADYYMNKQFSVSLNYEYTIRNSNVPIFDYTRSLVSLNAQAKL